MHPLIKMKQVSETSQWVRFEPAPWGLHLELKNREKIPGKGSAQPGVNVPTYSPIRVS